MQYSQNDPTRDTKRPQMLPVQNKNNIEYNIGKLLRETLISGTSFRIIEITKTEKKLRIKTYGLYENGLLVATLEIMHPNPCICILH